jgi:hypothetical protein
MKPFMFGAMERYAQDATDVTQRYQRCMVKTPCGTTTARSVPLTWFMLAVCWRQRRRTIVMIRKIHKHVEMQLTLRHNRPRKQAQRVVKHVEFFPNSSMKRALLFALLALVFVWWVASKMMGGSTMQSPSFPVPTATLTPEVSAEVKAHGWQALVVDSHTDISQASWEGLANAIKATGQKDEIEISREIYRVQGRAGHVTKIFWEYPPSVKTDGFNKLMNDWWKLGKARTQQESPTMNVPSDAKPAPAKP